MATINQLLFRLDSISRLHKLNWALICNWRFTLSQGWSSLSARIIVLSSKVGAIFWTTWWWSGRQSARKLIARCKLRGRVSSSSSVSLRRPISCHGEVSICSKIPNAARRKHTVLGVQAILEYLRLLDTPSVPRKRQFLDMNLNKCLYRFISKSWFLGTEEVSYGRLYNFSSSWCIHWPFAYS